ncbi:phage baseplate plug protein [Methylobacterium sp. A49B]
MSGKPQEIPMQPGNRMFSVELAGKSYLIRQTWNDADPFSVGGGTYYIDIGDASTSATLIAGLPLVPGSDLLGQFGYMEFGGSLVVTSDHNSGDPVTYDGLGTTSHLYFVPD